MSDYIVVVDQHWGARAVGPFPSVKASTAWIRTSNVQNDPEVRSAFVVSLENPREF